MPVLEKPATEKASWRLLNFRHSNHESEVDNDALSSAWRAVCKGKDVCPLWTDPATGNRIAATGCSDDQLLPTSFELAHGKHLTCDCSGAKGDRSTAWACGQQPFTHWDATVLHLNGTGKCCSLRMARAARRRCTWPGTGALWSLLGPRRAGSALGQPEQAGKLGLKPLGALC